MFMAVSATLCVSSVPNNFDMDASAFGTIPLLCIQATLYDMDRETSVSMCRAASLFRTNWFSDRGLPFLLADFT